MRTRYREINPFITKDGSEIRELMHPDVHGNSKQSFAEATVPAGSETARHKHIQTEEIYYISQGSGLMTLGDDRFEVRSGDTICIPPGTVHNIRNIGGTPLKILCCCSPPYSDSDTELVSGK